MIVNNLLERNIRITNARCYDLHESLVASGYPMLTKVVPRDSNESDMKRAIKLANTTAGSGHSNFLCGIRVSFDLTIPRYMWQEAQRYHWFDIVSSQSTMHKIAQMDLLDRENYTSWTPIEDMVKVKELQDAYVANDKLDNFMRLKSGTPEGLLLTARISTSYAQLKTIFGQRSHHRLQEWQQFCQWMLELPYGKELIACE